MRAKLVAMERAGTLGGGTAPPGARARPLPRPPGPASGAVGFPPRSWAHELPAPEVGCLLVSKQPGMDFFDGTVVLIAAHGGCPGYPPKAGAATALSSRGLPGWGFRGALSTASAFLPLRFLPAQTVMGCGGEGGLELCGVAASAR